MFQGRSASEFLELFKRKKFNHVPPIIYCYLGMRRQAADRGAKRFLKLIGKNRQNQANRQILAKYYPR